MDTKQDCKVAPVEDWKPPKTQAEKDAMQKKNDEEVNKQLTDIVDKLGLSQDQINQLQALNEKWIKNGMKGNMLNEAAKEEIFSKEQLNKLVLLISGDSASGVKPNPLMTSAQIWAKAGMRSCHKKHKDLSMSMNMSIAAGLAGASINMSGSKSSKVGCEPVTMMSNKLSTTLSNISCTINQQSSSQKTDISSKQSTEIDIANDLKIKMSKGSVVNLASQKVKITLVSISQMSSDSQKSIKDNLKSAVTEGLSLAGSLGSNNSKDGKTFINTDDPKVQQKINNAVDQSIHKFNNVVSSDKTTRVKVLGNMIIDATNSGQVNLWTQEAVIDVLSKNMIGDAMSNAIKSVLGPAIFDPEPEPDPETDPEPDSKPDPKSDLKPDPEKAKKIFLITLGTSIGLLILIIGIGIIIKLTKK